MARIHVGHPSYSGANRLAVCKSKLQAVEELRDRGFKRDDARTIVNEVCSKPSGYHTASLGNGDVVEVWNYHSDL